MKITVVSLFPEMIRSAAGYSIVKRGMEAGLFSLETIDPRSFTNDRHRTVDDTPFGGGAGMVLKPEPMFRAVRSITENVPIGNRRVLLMCPSGQTFSQAKAKELAGYEQLIFICGHYEGFDARITKYLADEAISIGDYVLTGGELPAMVITDAVSRMLPGVLGSAESAPTDSFYDGLLEFPQYTRPREYEDMQVPEILFSGDHAKIRAWRRQQALLVTRQNRPDLLAKAELSAADRKFLEKE